MVFSQITGPLDLALYTAVWQEIILLLLTPGFSYIYGRGSQMKDQKIKPVSIFYILSRVQ